MIALIIIGAIVLLIAILMMFSVRAEIKFYGGVLDLKVKYIFLTLYSLNTGEKKIEEESAEVESNVENTASDKSDTINDEASENTVEKNDKSEGNKTEEKTSEEVKKKEKLSDKVNGIKIKIEQFKIIWECSKKGLAKLFKHIYFTNIIIDFTAGGEDAMTAGTNYGKLNAIVYNGINFIRTWFTVTVKSVDIGCDFDSKKSRYDAECVIKLRVGTAVYAILMIAWALLLNLKKIKSVGIEDTDDENVNDNIT